MDLESLALVLVAVYLTECLVLVRRGALLCIRGLGSWTVVSSDQGLTTAQGSWRMLSVLPRFPASFQSSLWPFSANEKLLVSWTSASLEASGRPPQSALVISWDEVKTVEYDRRKVMINGVTWFEVRSDQEAVVLAERLTRLKKADAEKRLSLLNDLMKESLGEERFQKRKAELDTAVRALLFPAGFLVVYVLVLCPFLIYTRGLSAVGWWLLGGLYFQSLTLAVMFFRRHRKLYGRLGDERFARVFSVALSPVSAMRSPDVLARHGFEEFHPWALIRGVCPEAVVRYWAGRMVRDLQYPRLPEHPEGPLMISEVESVMRQNWVNLLKVELRSAGLTWEEFLKKPEATEQVHRAYCPRCHAQFVDVQVPCVECGGRVCLPL